MKEKEKTTLAQNKKDLCPEMLHQLASAHSKKLWFDNGFGERFIVSTVRPYRYYLHFIIIILFNFKNTYTNMCIYILQQTDIRSI